jgi:hypothetical protein
MKKSFHGIGRYPIPLEDFEDTYKNQHSNKLVSFFPPSAIRVSSGTIVALPTFDAAFKRKLSALEGPQNTFQTNLKPCFMRGDEDG